MIAKTYVAWKPKSWLRMTATSRRGRFSSTYRRRTICFTFSHSTAVGPALSETVGTIAECWEWPGAGSMLCPSHGHNAATKAIGNIVDRTLAACNEAADLVRIDWTIGLVSSCRESGGMRGFSSFCKIRHSWIAFPVLKSANQIRYATHHSALENPDGCARKITNSAEEESTLHAACCSVLLNAQNVGAHHPFNDCK